MKFNYVEIENCCKELYAILDEMKSINEGFRANVEKIKNGSVWQGKAANGFVKRCTTTLTICDFMEESLKNMILFIISSSENYEDSEGSIMGGIKDKLI